jgi:hypothetical protein
MQRLPRLLNAAAFEADGWDSSAVRNREMVVDYLLENVVTSVRRVLSPACQLDDPTGNARGQWTGAECSPGLEAD